MNNKRLFIVTGDHSGNIHGAEVVRALLKAHPDMEISAVGGEDMKQAGASLIADQSIMGKVGFAGLKTIVEHYLLGQKIMNYLEIFKPDAVLLIDYGGFNLQLAKQLKKKQYTVFYFIPPQVWATRKHRIKAIQKYIDHVFCIFPFEETLYQEYQIPVTYVGHPLAVALPEKPERSAFCNETGLDPAKPIIGLFPGSRKLEISLLLNLILKTAEKLKHAHPDAQFVLAQAGSLDNDFFTQAFDKMHAQLPGLPPITLVKDKNHALLGVSDAVILTSGTVTLEAALYGTPMVLLYKLPRLVYEIAIRLLYMPSIGLPNILSDPYHPVVPEFLQQNIKPEKIAPLVSQLLDKSSPLYQKQIDAFGDIQQKLYTTDPPAKRVSEKLYDLLNQPEEPMDKAISSRLTR